MLYNIVPWRQDFWRLNGVKELKELSRVIGFYQ
jgi:hypothetical protein